MKQYKTIAGPMHVSVDKGDSQSAFKMFADTMNRESANGWCYHSMETITVTEKPGCLQQAVSKTYYMLIFERDA